MAVLKSHWVWIAVAVVLLIALYSLNKRQTQAALDGKQAHDYLCFQKDVVIPGRINATLNYERQVQLGQRTPIPGITLADLSTSIKRDQDSLKYLTDRIDC